MKSQDTTIKFIKSFAKFTSENHSDEIKYVKAKIHYAINHI